MRGNKAQWAAAENKPKPAHYILPAAADDAMMLPENCTTETKFEEACL